MKLLQKSKLSGIQWWDEYRKELNVAIDCYNRMMLGDMSKERAYAQVGMAYASIDTKVTDYSPDFDVIIDELNNRGMDTSFYHGFGGE